MLQQGLRDGRRYHPLCNCLSASLRLVMVGDRAGCAERADKGGLLRITECLEPGLTFSSP